MQFFEAQLTEAQTDVDEREARLRGKEEALAERERTSNDVLRRLDEQQQRMGRRERELVSATKRNATLGRH